MRKKSRVLLLLPLFCLLSLSVTSEYARSQDDSLIVGSMDPVPPDAKVSVDVRLRVSKPVGTMTMPFKLVDSDNLDYIEIDSVVWSSWYLDNKWAAGEGFEDVTINSVDKLVSILAIWFVGFLPPGDDTLLTIYFTTSPFWDSEETVTIDTTRVPPENQGLVFFDTTTWPDPDTIPVAFEQGSLGPTWIREVDSEGAELPQEFTLGQNYPNPFNASTLIRFALPEDGHVKIDVFNVLGRRVTTLVDQHLTAGYKETRWDGRDSRGAAVGSGIYFYRICTERFTEVRKMVLLK